MLQTMDPLSSSNEEASATSGEPYYERFHRLLADPTPYFIAELLTKPCAKKDEAGMVVFGQIRAHVENTIEYIVFFGDDDTHFESCSAEKLLQYLIFYDAHKQKQQQQQQQHCRETPTTAEATVAAARVQGDESQMGSISSSELGQGLAAITVCNSSNSNENNSNNQQTHCDNLLVERAAVTTNNNTTNSSNDDDMDQEESLPPTIHEMLGNTLGLEFLECYEDTRLDLKRLDELLLSPDCNDHLVHWALCRIVRDQGYHLNFDAACRVICNRMSPKLRARYLEDGFFGFNCDYLLHDAARNGSLALVSTLLPYFNVNQENPDGDTPLSCAAQAKVSSLGISKLLVEQGKANVNLGGEYGPIYKAVESNKNKLVCYLLVQKADPNLNRRRIDEGDTSLPKKDRCTDLAIKNKNSKMLLA